MSHSCYHALVRPILLAVAAIPLAAAAVAQTTPTGSAELTYHVDVRERGEDRFQVRLTVAGLPADSDVLQFAATAPGTYQVMDVGRFVEGLRAEDAEGNAIPVEQISTNQWRLASPADVREISYSVAETWDKWEVPGVVPFKRLDSSRAALSVR